MEKLLLWQKDSHPYPHYMNLSGGCACTCDRCLILKEDFYRCRCGRCNEDCVGTGRLGRAEMVRQERRKMTPERLGQAASRWYLTRTGLRIFFSLERNMFSILLTGAAVGAVACAVGSWISS